MSERVVTSIGGSRDLGPPFLREQNIFAKVFYAPRFILLDELRLLVIMPLFLIFWIRPDQTVLHQGAHIPPSTFPSVITDIYNIQLYTVYVTGSGFLRRMGQKMKIEMYIFEFCV